MDQRKKDFSMVLPGLGEPDEDFTVLCGGGFAKWVVQESPRGKRELFVPWVDKRPRMYITLEDREAEVHFTGRMLDGNVFSSSRENGFPITFIPTQVDVMEGFSLAVSSMQEGEKAIFTIPPKFTLTKSGCPASIPWNIPPNQTLWFDIELISFTTDIHGDQGIIKKTTKIGAGDQHPCDLDEVLVRLIGKLQDGTVFDRRGHDGQEPVVFYPEIGCITSSTNETGCSQLMDFTENFVAGLKEAIMTMVEGEVASVIIPPQHAFGTVGSKKFQLAVVPPNSVVIYEIELVSVKVDCDIRTQSLSTRKLKYDRECRGRRMVIPSTARPQGNPSQQPVSAASAAVGAQSPATPATPAGGSGATAASKNQSSGTHWKGLASCFGFLSSHVNSSHCP